MTELEILKALENCSDDRVVSCRECPYLDIGSSSCVATLCKDAAKLIKKQGAEIESLQKAIILKNHALLSINDIAKKVPQTISDHCFPDFNRDGLPVNVWRAREGYEAIDALLEQIKKEVTT